MCLVYINIEAIWEDVGWFFMVCGGGPLSLHLGCFLIMYQKKGSNFQIFQGVVNAIDCGFMFPMSKGHFFGLF